MEKIFKKIKGLLISGALLFIVFGILPATAQAATLYFSPSSGTHAVGTTLFTASVYVSSADQAINAASGVISFPSDKLAVESLSKSGSIFSLWVQEPSFSNTAGTINFEGIALNPGFTGDSGKLITLNFRVKAAGVAVLNFFSGSTLANDGKGTNILSSLGKASFELAKAPAQATPPAGAPPTPIIISNPSSDDNNWYNFNSVEFRWNLPAGVNGVSYDISNNADYRLPKTNQGLIPKIAYDLAKFADGAWYFFVQFHTASGWGPAAMKTLKLDRTPPEPFSIMRKDNDLINPQPVFEWSTTDRTSGLAYYEMKIGDGDWFNPEAIKNDSYVLPLQSPIDSRKFIVRAYDNAGNFRESSIDFQVLQKVLQKTGFYFWWYKFIEVLTRWLWLILAAVSLALITLYFLIYRLLRWRANLKNELREFKNELRRDLKRLESQLEIEKGDWKLICVPAGSRKPRETLQKETEHIEEDIKEEIKKIEEFTDD